MCCCVIILIRGGSPCTHILVSPALLVFAVLALCLPLLSGEFEMSLHPFTVADVAQSHQTYGGDGAVD